MSLTEIFMNRNIKESVPYQLIVINKVKSLIPKLDVIKNQLVFSFIEEIVISYPIDDIVVELFDRLCKRIFNELDLVRRIKFKPKSEGKKKQQQVNSNIIKCFNIIRAVCENAHNVELNYVRLFTSGQFRSFSPAFVRRNAAY